MKRHEISEKQWNGIKDKLLPERKPQRGRQEKATGKCSTQFCTGWTQGFHGGIYWSGSAHGKAYTTDLGYGQKLEYRKIAYQPWLSRICRTKQRWCWTRTLVKVHQHASSAKKRVSRRNRVKSGRLDDKSLYGNGWAWKCVTLFALQ